jgi:hypothetical protein
MTNDSINQQVNTAVKRRRSISPTGHEQLPTMTLDQLKLKYGNMSVMKDFVGFDFLFYVYFRMKD